MTLSIVLLIFIAHLDQGKAFVSPNLGQIQWERNYGQAIERSIQEHKPVLMLLTSFGDEATAWEYGQSVLSNPLIAEAVQDHFIPLAINNEGGREDQVILERLGEPRGNKPVVRIFLPNRKLPQERLAGHYSESALAMSMIIGLAKYGFRPPVYLRILAGEEQANLRFFVQEKSSPFYFIPMTKTQLSLINKALRTKKNPVSYLSPNQAYIYRRVQDQKTKPSVLSFNRDKSLMELVALLKKKTHKFH